MWRSSKCERREQMITITLALPDKLELHNLLQFARRLSALISKAGVREGESHGTLRVVRVMRLR
jgi:hypothetical protein